MSNLITQSLNFRHYSEIVEGSGVSPDIAELNFRTVEDPQEIDQILNRNTQRRWCHSEELVPAWVVSGVDPRAGEHWLQGCQVKPDFPPIGNSGKPQKYWSARGEDSQPLFLNTGDAGYWPGVLADKSIPIYITEGAKKAAVLLTYGYAAISLPGVWNGQKKGKLNALLAEFCGPGRTVVFAFDADFHTNPKVRQALDRLGRLIAATGAVVRIANWSIEQAKGVDDLLVNAGRELLKEILANPLTFEEWREMELKEDEGKESEPPQQQQDYRKLKQFFGDGLRYNLLTKNCELHGEVFEVANAKQDLAIDFGMKLKCGEDPVARICTRIAKENQYSPVRDYLEDVWLRYGKDRQSMDALKNFAKTYLGTDEPLHQLMVEKSLIAAVARAYEPGCKVDSMTIFQGKQGELKSTMLRILGSPEWFDDSLDMDTLGDKDSRLQLHSGWIIEFQEAEQLFSTKRQRGTLKGFLTTRTDRLRRPYGRSFEALDRHFLIFGTTNHKQFLDDPTGNRRFWVIPVKKQIPIELLEANRDLIWGAAVELYKRGTTWWLTPAEAALAAEHAQEYESQDPWHDDIANFVECRQQSSIAQIFNDVLKLDLCKQTLFEQRRVANILTSLGWTKSPNPVSFDGKKQRVWNAPAKEEPKA